MKATFLFCLLSALCFGQVTVNIWDVRPDSICPGDTITLNYKLGNLPNPPDPSTSNQIYMSPYTIWSGNYLTLKAQKKELFTNGVDCVYVVKIAAPTTATPGLYHITTPAANSTGTYNAIYVKDCSCTLTAGFTYTTNNLEVSFTSTTAGATSTTSYLWDFGQGWQSGTAINSYTFYAPGTYTVGLNATNKFCVDDVFTVITVSAAPTNTLDVGIQEYEKAKQNPVYFDLMGNKVNPSPGVLLIEQRGTIRKKVVISMW